MFSDLEQKAIQEKLDQLSKVKDGSLTPRQLADLITQRRVSWFKENKGILWAKYSDLSDEEKAYRIIYFDHMRINPKHSEMVRVAKNEIKINSYNFCPYLEACKKLGLSTQFVCREIGEPSIQAVCELINPKLKFYRNYSKIRPDCYFCEEFIKLNVT